MKRHFNLFTLVIACAFVVSCAPNQPTTPSIVEEKINVYSSFVYFEQDLLNTDFPWAIFFDDRGRPIDYLRSKKPENGDTTKIWLGDFFTIKYTEEIFGYPFGYGIYNIQGRYISRVVLKAEKTKFTYSIIDGQGQFIPDDKTFKFNYSGPEFYFIGTYSMDYFSNLKDGDRLIGYFNRLNINPETRVYEIFGFAIE